MKLLGRTESKITKDKNGESVPYLKIAQVVLVHCNIVNNDYQQEARVLHTFFQNKPFGSLLEISPTNDIYLKTFKSEFQEIVAQFIDQNSDPLEKEDLENINRKSITSNLIIQLFNNRDTIYVKGYGFLSFAKNLSNKYNQKFLIVPKKFTTDAIKKLLQKV